jgi:uncharacterized membrane protein
MMKAILKYLLVVFYFGAGVMHFVRPEFYLKLMPPYLPWHLPLVYISGVIEMALAVGIMIPKFTRLSAWGIIALLIAVFPANIHLALHPEIFPNYSPWVSLVRLPLQGVLILWAYWYTKE